ARVGLLVLRVESDDGHGLALPTPKDSPSLPAASLPGSVRTTRSVTDALRVDHYGAADRASEGAGVHRRVLVVMISALAVVLAWAIPANAITHGQPDDGAHPYVGELLFFVPDARFDDPGSWFTCSGTLLDDHVVLTAGHCTYGTGRDGASTTANGGSGSGGTDVWISFSESPDFSILPPSS